MNWSSETFSDHVILLDPSYKPSRQGDLFIASILAICLVIGVTGNILALYYFVTCEKKKLAGRLYIAISFTDICTCVAHIPVMLSLYGYRHPVFFNSLVFTVFWTILFEHLQNTSIFLVMMMSVTRALAIRIPFYKINPPHLIAAFCIYSVAMAAETLIRHQFGVYYLYIMDIAYSVKGSENPTWSFYSNISNLSLIGLPSIIIFVSFILSAVKLYRQQVPPSKRLAHKASTTIAIFTAIFLFCNIPFFGNTVAFVLSKFVYQSFPGPFFSPPLMYSYSWVVSKVLFVVINATCNPIVYFTRMSGFATWTKSENTPSQNVVSLHNMNARSGQVARVTSNRARDVTGSHASDDVQLCSS